MNKEEVTVKKKFLRAREHARDGTNIVPWLIKNTAGELPNSWPYKLTLTLFDGLI